jgi:hypothetical protein
MSLIIDTAGRPYGPAVLNSPYDGVIRYLSDGGDSLPGKLLLPEEAASYLAAGQTLTSNWETTADSMQGGYNAGSIAARYAWAQHKECNGPDNAVIYFSADWDTTEADQTNINAYLQGCIDYLGIQSVGVYGSYYVCKRVYEWNPAIYLWQTMAWSGDQVFEHIHLLQRIGVVNVGGAECDVNEVRQDNYGQWNLHIGETEMGNITSLVDGSTHTTEEMLAFIDYHAWRSDKILTEIGKANTVDTSDVALKGK